MRKNYLLMQKDIAITDITNQLEKLIDNTNENHLSFLEFYKDIIYLEHKLKSSYQSGERNAAYKLEALIKDKVNMIMKFDENQENISRIRTTILDIVNSLKNT